VDVTEDELTEFFSVVSPLLDERQRRVMAGAAALSTVILLIAWHVEDGRPTRYEFDDRATRQTLFSSGNVGLKGCR